MAMPNRRTLAVAANFLVVVLTWLCAACVHAEPKACHRELTVAYYDAGPFYDPATGEGIDPDVIAEVSRRTGCTIVGRFLSRGLLLEAFKQGKLDIATSAVPSPERLRYGAHVPFLWGRNSLIVKAGQDVRDTPDAFLADPRLRLGIINRYVYGPGWDAWVAGLRAQQRVVVVGDMHQLERLLEAGRIDAYPTVLLSSSVYAGLYGRHPTLRRLGWFENSPVNGRGLLLSLSTLDDATRAAISRAIAGMREDGTIAAILSRHISDRKQVQALQKRPK